jgi:hypothetical protein
MKKVSILLILVLGLTGCGAYQDIQNACDTQLCDMLLGEEVETEVLEEEGTLSAEAIANLEAQVLELQIQLTELKLDMEPSFIEEIVDPCGDSAGVDEILLRTRDWQYIAYFQNGNRRMLTILEPEVWYQTTDSQKCNFVITSSGSIEY